MTTRIASRFTATAISQRLAAGMVCLFLGSAIIYGVGFSNLSFAHNAAHDTRHAVGFPCH